MIRDGREPKKAVNFNETPFKKHLKDKGITLARGAGKTTGCLASVVVMNLDDNRILLDWHV